VEAPGDWTTQTANPETLLRAHKPEAVKHMADGGDREAQFSLGFVLTSELAGDACKLGAAGRTPLAEAEAEEGMALLEKAAGQGHAYAMLRLGEIHSARKEHELAVAGGVLRTTTRPTHRRWIDDKPKSGRG